MDFFKLKLDSLHNGWADLSLFIDDDEKILCFENVPRDTLYDLLESALRIARDIDSTVTFYNCSYRDYIIIKKTEHGSCNNEAPRSRDCEVSIAGYEKCVAELRGIRPVEIKIESNRLDLPTKMYCKAVIRMFDKYIFDFSIDEYTKNWGTFPKNELERLRTNYHAL